ncbi:DNA polymerase I, partial [Methyloceanibacter sp.]|uniref:DNA polymerase I n=1 Tax=Methyloceanibacter sp. TaxID=1965321 RepID=UPI00351BAE32
THIAAIFDLSEHTFRNDLFSDYKANRSEPPDDLIPQFPLIRDAVHAFNVACIEKRGYEADDLIATYALQALEAGAEVTIVSSDKDLMQLVRPGIRMYDTMKNKVIGEAEVLERFGVPPSKVVEVQALIGDSTDNVPGVPGIGVKTAALLINEFGDLDTLLARASEIKQQKRRESLIAFADQARLSRTLVLLDCVVPLDVPLAETALRQPDPTALLGFMRKLEFSTLVRRVADGLGVEAPEGAAPPPKTQARKKNDYDHPLRRTPRGEAAPPSPEPKTDGGSPAQLVVERASKLEMVGFDRSNYETMTDAGRLADLLDAARYQGHFAFRAKLNSSDPMQGELVGVALALVPGHAAYVPLAHRASDGLDLGGETIAQVPMREALNLLKSILEDEGVLKIVQNAKFDMIALARYGIALVAVDDPCLMSYALDAGRAEHLPAELAGSLMGYTCLTEKEVLGSGRNALSFDRVAVARAAEYAGEETDIGLRLWMILKPRLAAESVTTVYETLERPLAPVLAEMERAGVKVERATLAQLSGSFAQTIARLEDEIRELAGEDFNIGSPKQLGEILFDKMNLPGGRRTKTRAWSTDAAALEELVAEGHELPRKVLDWRLLAKLKNTYTDAIPAYIHPETGRVHTSYALAATTTGRLSSQEPNLQNIPVRTAEGRAIRKAFVAEPGKKLISADYSQIELRVLAHMADTPTLRQAFADGLDIHAMTASEMFGVPVPGMDPAIRRRAKAINFGIVYGISSVGLAAQLGIGRSEAGAYIKTYFERFPGIRDYMEQMKAEVRRTGYVKTLFGRKVHYPEINTKNPGLRGNYERAAINAPIQGSAADIIRRAMIRMAPALAAA